MPPPGNRVGRRIEVRCAKTATLHWLTALTDQRFGARILEVHGKTLAKKGDRSTKKLSNNRQKNKH